LYATEKLAEFVAGLKTEAVPAPVLASARACVLDLLGAAAAGWRGLGPRAARAAAARLFAPGPASVWFSDIRLEPAGAALANCAAASALDLDDGHRAAGGHPGASIIPASLAVAQETKASGREFLAAVVIGYEVAVRVGAGRDLSRLDTFSTGRWCNFGAAAAAGWLRRLEPAKLAQALALAGVHGPNLSAAGYSRVMGNQAKEGIPWSTLTGLAAAALAEAGFTGPTDLLDHPNYYLPDKILAGLGQSWAVSGVYFKPYSCCRWLHAALDGLLDLLARNRLEAGEVDSVEVHTFRRALNLNNYPDPPTLESAQYSLPFCLAAAALDGREALLPLREELLGRPELTAWAGRVRLEHDPELEALFPAATPARVVLRAGGRSFETTVQHPWGDPAKPMTPADLEAKFRRVSGGELPPADQEELIAAAADLEGRGLERLISRLAQSR